MTRRQSGRASHDIFARFAGVRARFDWPIKRDRGHINRAIFF